jgi:hypothetical protein
MSQTEQFVRDSDNQIRLQLLEDGAAVSGEWTQLDICFGGVTITRAESEDGVALSTTTGILTINPGDLTTDEKAAIAALPKKMYRVEIIVTSSENDDGAVFGGDGSERIYFRISDKPA